MLLVLAQQPFTYCSVFILIVSQIQGKGQGHDSLKVGNPSIFNIYFLHHLQWERLILKLGHNIYI